MFDLSIQAILLIAVIAVPVLLCTGYFLIRAAVGAAIDKRLETLTAIHLAQAGKLGVTPKDVRRARNYLQHLDEPVDFEPVSKEADVLIGTMEEPRGKTASLDVDGKTGERKIAMNA